MSADDIFPSVDEFAAHLRKLHKKRKSRVFLGRAHRSRRAALTKADRETILRKTAGRCHLCGGSVDPNDFQADHVLAHSTGGTHSVDNYLPTHPICNNYRWHYEAEEFQWIIKLGVWMRSQIKNETSIGRAGGQNFCQHEARRAKRRV